MIHTSVTCTLVTAALITVTVVVPAGQPPKGKTMSPRVEQVVALLKAIETGAQEPVAVINPTKYIQHNLAAADGLAGFGALLKQLPKGSAKVNTVRAFEDGDFVFTHTEYNFFGPKIGFDIFRFENGQDRRALGQPAGDSRPEPERPHHDRRPDRRD